MDTMPAHPPQGLENLPIGRKESFRKTVSETDIYLFAGISGDFHPNHVDEEYMSRTPYRHRIAHGALLVGYMATVSGKMALALPGTVVTYGFDRIRFLKAVYIGDTITVTYEVERHEQSTGKIFSRVTVTNQRDELVCVATHILKIVG